MDPNTSPNQRDSPNAMPGKAAPRGFAEKIIVFKQEINELIDNYLAPTNGTEQTRNLCNNKLLEQMMMYFNRMKIIYESRYASGDEEEEDEFVSDDFSDGNESKCYEELFRDRIFQNKDRDEFISGEEKELRKKLFGISDSADSLFFAEEASSDPVIYDEPVGGAAVVDEVGDENDADYQSHNLKKVYDYPPKNSDIILDGGDVDYEDPVVKTPE